MKLYYHKTSGGAEYLMDTFINWEHKGKKGKEGHICDKTKYVIRIDGDIKKDAELIIAKKQPDKKQYNKLMDALNFIDELACISAEDNDNGEAQQLEKAYKKVANFIRKHTK